MSVFNLFAYGTLKRGASAHHRITGCEPVGDGWVGGTLYDIEGRFPALLLYGSAPVHGEIWRCPAELLLRLDAYEGTATRLFRRVAVDVATNAGTVPCWTYAAGPALARRLLPERRVASGRWLHVSE